MSILEWTIWAISCVVIVWGIITFLAELFRIDPFPEGPECFLPYNLRVFIPGLEALLMAVGVIITVATETSKFHLLWFMPLCFCGVTWLVTRGWLAWDLLLHWYDMRTRQANLHKKEILLPKKTPGPNSKFKKYPLLYLYFDDFNELRSSWNELHFAATLRETDIRSSRHSLEEIMQDESLFLKLYKDNLVKLRLRDGAWLCQEDDQFYWDRVIHPEKYTDELSRIKNPDIAAHYEKDIKEINAVVEAMKQRYSL